MAVIWGVLPTRPAMRRPSIQSLCERARIGLVVQHNDRSAVRIGVCLDGIRSATFFPLKHEGLGLSHPVPRATRLGLHSKPHDSAAGERERLRKASSLLQTVPPVHLRTDLRHGFRLHGKVRTGRVSLLRHPRTASELSSPVWAARQLAAQPPAELLRLGHDDRRPKPMRA